MANAPDFRSGYWGILVVDPVRGDTLYSRNADKLFMPASNMKIVTGAVALAQLGPDFRWSTSLFARGRGPARACSRAISSYGATAIHRSARTCAATRCSRFAISPIRCVHMA